MSGFTAEIYEVEIRFTIFTVFIKVYPSRYLIVVVDLIFETGLRNLEIKEETISAKCPIDSEDANKEDGVIRYNCVIPKEKGAKVMQGKVVEIDFKEPDVNDNEINMSEEVSLQSEKVHNQTKIINKMTMLNNAKLTKYPSYFIVSGELDNDDFKSFGPSNLNLEVADDSTGQLYNVSCEVINSNEKKYQLKCTPDRENGVKGSLFLATVSDPNHNALCLNITDEDYVNYYKNGTDSTTKRNNIFYRKSSSGLSGGAIAGIVIACVIALIIASIVALLCRNNKGSPVYHTSTPSIVGLKNSEYST